MPQIHQSSYAGIDGCRYGWIAVIYTRGIYSIDLFADFNSLIKKLKSFDRILIDIPIGLSTKNFPRTIDATLRKQLPGRGSTVFNVPCKSAVYAKDYETAKKLNLEEEGKSVSIQTFNIQPKIKEVDQYLSQNNINTELIESHPEFCFAQLKGEVLSSRKNTREGQLERLNLLRKYNASTLSIFDEGIKRFKRKDVKPDDIIDAICLCMVNHLAGTENLQFLTDTNRFSEDGFPFRIGFWKPKDYSTSTS